MSATVHIFGPLVGETWWDLCLNDHDVTFIADDARFWVTFGRKGIQITADLIKGNFLLESRP